MRRYLRFFAARAAGFAAAFLPDAAFAFAFAFAGAAAIDLAGAPALAGRVPFAVLAIFPAFAEAAAGFPRGALFAAGFTASL